jgi:putative transposase
MIACLVKQAIMNGQSAYLKFFKVKEQPGYKPYGIAQIKTGKPLTYYDMQGHPKHKKKNTDEPKMYFVKTDASVIIPCERHRIKIPTLGWVRLKEKGYLPTRAIIRSGSVSKHAGRYYVPVLVDEEPQETTPTERDGIGIDLGVKTFATCSDEVNYDNINKTEQVKCLEKKPGREQRKLSRKYESYEQRKLKGEATRQNIQKQVMVVQKLHQRLANIRTDYINKTVNTLAKTKPDYITIEDLNVKKA